LLNAIHAFTQAVFDRGGIVIFGAHPTFQHLIFDKAKQRRPYDYVQAVKMYISLHFVTMVVVDESRNNATVMEINAVNNDRAENLTAMREAMIHDEEAVCMVVMGGKTKRPNIAPGVDEEIGIAKAFNLPVFLVGSTGGRTAELAAGCEAEDWRDKLNNQLSVRML